METTRIKRIGRSNEYKVEVLQEINEDNQVRVEIWETTTITAKKDPCKHCPLKN